MASRVAHLGLRNISGSLAMLAAMRRASLRVSRCSAERRPGPAGDGRAMIYGKEGSEIKRSIEDQEHDADEPV
jgi:hypothetical protein